MSTRKDGTAGKSKKSARKRSKNGQAKDMMAGSRPSEQNKATLEIAIGREVRSFRKRMMMTVTELARQAGLSSGMLSKIENGMTSSSLGTL